jgi:hypothetical protein
VGLPIVVLTRFEKRHHNISISGRRDGPLYNGLSK